jgi:hypothetical protein
MRKLMRKLNAQAIAGTFINSIDWKGWTYRLSGVRPPSAREVSREWTIVYDVLNPDGAECFFGPVAVKVDEVTRTARFDEFICPPE